MRKITIVGAGQVGASLAHRFLNAGYNVRIIDAGTSAVRPHKQVPWGWCRGHSLQQDIRAGPISMPFNTKKRYGPMLVTTRDQDRIARWNQWLRKNPDSDAHILSPDRASDRYGIEETVFVCDSRDFVINYEDLNNEIWGYLRSHRNCELLEGVQVTAINNNSRHDTDALITSEGKEIPVEHVIIAIGNQTSKLKIRDSMGYFEVNYGPVIHVELPYILVRKPKREYLALWNDKSSIQLFDDYAKVGCGLVCNLIDSKIRHLPYFMGLIGKGMLHYPPKILEQLIDGALDDLGNPERLSTIQSCIVDMTPTTTPIVKPITNNAIVIGGFSGSGATAYTGWFGDAIIDTIRSGYISDRLKYFNKLSFFQHVYPSPEIRPYI